MVPAMVDSVKHLEKIYGLVFSKMVAGYSTGFEARKINDPSSPAVERIEECAN